MALQRTEELILNQLIHSDEYFRKVSPFLDVEYFQERVEVILYETIEEYTKKYSIAPSVDSLSVLVNEKDGISGEEISDINEYIEVILTKGVDCSNKFDFVVDQTEKFCKEKSMYNAVIDAFSIINGEDKDKRTTNAIPDIMKEALRVSFDTNIGHDYMVDAEARYDMLHEKNNKIPFDIEALNIITNGGLEAKTLNCVLASTGAGKSIFMCHYAASAITQGKNVLYITMEMAEEKIATRIDANLMDVELDDFDSMSKDSFMSRFDKIKKFGGFLGRIFGTKRKSLGKLIIKEYPTGTPNVNHFRFLLDDLALKKNFVPDLIIVDYLNICGSSRVTKAAGSYQYVLSIAEELRGLAVEMKVPILTGTQTNRGGYSNSDIEITDTSESIGLPAVLDLYIALMTNDTLAKIGRIAVKQLKNRYRDENKDKYFTLGLEKPKMRFFHVSDWNKGVEDNGEELVPVQEETFTMEERLNKPSTKGRFEGITL